MPPKTTGGAKRPLEQDPVPAHPAHPAHPAPKPPAKKKHTVLATMPRREQQGPHTIGSADAFDFTGEDVLVAPPVVIEEGEVLVDYDDYEPEGT